MPNDDKMASLKAMSALSGVEVELKEVCQDWILLTYDLPHNKEGDKARSEFLHKAKTIGAVQHTESVYLLPWTPMSESMAIEVSRVGNAFIWLSSVKDNQKARKLTNDYDADIKRSISSVKKRITKMKRHAEDGKSGLVERMRVKTDRMIKDLAGIVARRGSKELCRKVDELKRESDSITIGTSGTIRELEELL